MDVKGGHACVSWETVSQQRAVARCLFNNVMPIPGLVREGRPGYTHHHVAWKSTMQRDEPAPDRRSSNSAFIEAYTFSCQPESDEDTGEGRQTLFGFSDMKRHNPIWWVDG